LANCKTTRVFPLPLPSSSSSRMRNLDGWMTERMTGRMDGKDDHHHRNRTKPMILYKKIGVHANTLLKNLAKIFIDVDEKSRPWPSITEGMIWERYERPKVLGALRDRQWLTKKKPGLYALLGHAFLLPYIHRHESWTLGKPYEIKLRCYWERFREQLRNLGNFKRTQWEHVGGKEEKTKKATPPNYNGNHCHEDFCFLPGWDFILLALLAYYQGKDIIVFRFIIEYSSFLKEILAPK